jgi:ferrochelatase
VLNAIILTKRPPRSGKAYRAIWNKELDESPLRTITRLQAEKLSEAFEQNPRVVVDWAMRYGKPSIASRLSELQAMGCERILLVPLYPQYSAATTASVCDKAFDALKAMRWQPALRVAPPYYDDPSYIDALAASVRDNLGTLDFEPERIVASFHGLSMAYFRKGDPYYCHCQKTARLLREALGWDKQRLVVTFQSRFGRAEWLQPYTDKTLARLASDGVKRLAVITPGFATDCVETLEEIAIGGGEIFREHGGENFAVLPCLNDSAAGMKFLAAHVTRELRGWA